MNNKLWEGHRMILPELREKILQNNQEKLPAAQPKPASSEIPKQATNPRRRPKPATEEQ